MTRALGFANPEHIAHFAHQYNYLGNPLLLLLNYNKGNRFPVSHARRNKASALRRGEFERRTVSSPPRRKAEPKTDPPGPEETHLENDFARGRLTVGEQRWSLIQARKKAAHASAKHGESGRQLGRNSAEFALHHYALNYYDED
jgi:hypothetical protein